MTRPETYFPCPQRHPRDNGPCIFVGTSHPAHRDVHGCTWTTKTYQVNYSDGYYPHVASVRVQAHSRRHALRTANAVLALQAQPDSSAHAWQLASVYHVDREEA
jgi:hypothetical protein